MEKRTWVSKLPIPVEKSVYILNDDDFKSEIKLVNTEVPNQHAKLGFILYM